jgi:phosphoribosyl 1,2-cyclic phosphodiesterase
VKLKIWGARGSVPAPGPETTRYGGNTSCVEVRLSDGSLLVLDAGTGIRGLGLALGREDAERVNVLLTHLHLDHIQGLMFFTPLFNPNAEVVIWGPSSPEASLRERIGRYISAPLAPLEVRELPCQLSFRDSPTSDWQIGPARISAASVTHRGPTLAYRVTDGDTSLCYIPDHEPAVGVTLAELDAEWLSGYDLAHGASLLLHDCQYTDDEYPGHVGWGHSAMSDALTFAARTEVERALLFHHDPLHTDSELDAMYEQALERWTDLGCSPRPLEMARERQELTIAAPARVSGASGTAPVL